MNRHAALAQALLAAVRAQHFEATPDAWRGGAAVARFPSIDLAVAAFPHTGAPVWANVLFSREHPAGGVAAIDARAGSVGNIGFDADVRDAALESIAWRADADWSNIEWRALPLHGAGAERGPASARRPGSEHSQGLKRFVAPYPASLLKLMVAVGVGLAVDRSLLAEWPADVEPMLVTSDNDATDRMVALLHRENSIEPLNQRLRELGLAMLQLNGTTAAGGWRNGDGAGVGMIHMTAWDTVRLLWLLDEQAPAAPWLQAAAPFGEPPTPLLQPASQRHLHALLRRQQLDEVLSSGALRDVPGWVAGLPDAPAFAHKTGSTDNYAADAGIFHSGAADSRDASDAGAEIHYLIAVLSSLGRRHAPHARCATTWGLPALGAAVHRLMQRAMRNPR